MIAPCNRLLHALAVMLWLSPVLALGGDPLAAQAEHASGPVPGPKEGLATMITALVVFGIVLLGLSRLGWPRLCAALDARQQKIREEILAAEAARQQAREALEQYERSLAQARAEAQRMLEQTRAQQQALAAELRAKADAELAAMKERARRDIETARRAALAEVYEHAAHAATQIAARILRLEASQTDQERLLAEAINELRAIRS